MPISNAQFTVATSEYSWSMTTSDGAALTRNTAFFALQLHRITVSNPTDVSDFSIKLVRGHESCIADAASTITTLGGATGPFTPSTVTSVNSVSTTLTVDSGEANTNGNYKVCVCENAASADVVYGNAVCYDYTAVPSTSNGMFLTVGPLSSDIGAQAGANAGRWSAKVDQAFDLVVSGEDLGNGDFVSPALRLHTGSTCNGDAFSDATIPSTGDVNDDSITFSGVEVTSAPASGKLTVCISASNDGVYSKYGELTVTDRFDLERLWILDPDNVTSVEITGQNLSRTGDRIMFIDCQQSCGSAPPSDAVLRPQTSCGSAELTTYTNFEASDTYSAGHKLHFSGVRFNGGGTYKVCACDSTILGGRPCETEQDFGVEVGKIYVSGIYCLLQHADFNRATCYRQDGLGSNGLRCGSYVSPVPGTLVYFFAV